MELNTILLIVFILLMLGCCGKMLYMGLRKRDKGAGTKEPSNSSGGDTDGYKK